jgi:hypothetical protein
MTAMTKRISRREFLQTAALAGGAIAMVSCAPAAPAAKPTEAAQEPVKEAPKATEPPAASEVKIS